MRSREKPISILVFLFAIVLFATGVVASLAGILLLVLGEHRYSIVLIVYAALAVPVAMRGSDRSVLFAGAVLWLPWLFVIPSKSKGRNPRRDANRGLLSARKRSFD